MQEFSSPHQPWRQSLLNLSVRRPTPLYIHTHTYLQGITRFPQGKRAYQINPVLHIHEGGVRGIRPPPLSPLFAPTPGVLAPVWLSSQGRSLIMISTGIERENHEAITGLHFTLIKLNKNTCRVSRLRELWRLHQSQVDVCLHGLSH